MNKFKPEKLTDSAVIKIFNACILEGKTSNSVPISLYQENSDSKLYFDYDKLGEHEKEIAYLFGQLKNVHLTNQQISIPDLAIKYDDKSWVENKSSFMKFVYLGIAASQISKVSKKYGKALNLSIKPTLSPDDPNFEKWYAEHKSEWEDVKAGQEPGDE